MRYIIPIGLLIIICGACGLTTIAQPKLEEPYPGAIDMVEPNGWMPGRDATYAGDVNLPNAQANFKNAQAEAALLEAYKAENNTAGKMGWLFGAGEMFLCMTVFILCGGGYVLVVSIEHFAKKRAENIEIRPVTNSTEIRKWKGM